MATNVRIAILTRITKFTDLEHERSGYGELRIYCVRIEILTALTMNIVVLLSVIPCSLIGATISEKLFYNEDETNTFF
jgi:hypothetical protein